VKFVNGTVGISIPPFTLDITDSLRSDENELIVSVSDPTDKGLQQRGKQTLRPQGIWYTSVSGIWQTVWLEGVPAISIESLRLTPDLDARLLNVDVVIRGTVRTESVCIEAEASLNGNFVSSVTGDVNASLRLSIPDPKAWSPADPTLYDLRVRLIQEDRYWMKLAVILRCVNSGAARDGSCDLH
jgi:beta-galactosidase/beta-glucuronidase